MVYVMSNAKEVVTNGNVWYLHHRYRHTSKCWVCQCARCLERGKIIHPVWCALMTTPTPFVHQSYVHQLLSQPMIILVESKHTFPLFWLLFYFSLSTVWIRQNWLILRIEFIFIDNCDLLLFFFSSSLFLFPSMGNCVSSNSNAKIDLNKKKKHFKLKQNKI